jgi:hypothetical protein
MEKHLQQKLSVEKTGRAQVVFKIAQRRNSATIGFI